MSLKLSVFAGADENLLEGTGNEIPYYLFHTLCRCIPHGVHNPKKLVSPTPVNIEASHPFLHMHFQQDGKLQ